MLFAVRCSFSVGGCVFAVAGWVLNVACSSLCFSVGACYEMCVDCFMVCVVVVCLLFVV